jgi:hypothetical protein
MQEKHPIQPEYIRLPAHGRIEPYSGLNRTALERLVIPKAENNYEPPVQSKLFNPSGGKRWVRLIIFRSLMAQSFQAAQWTGLSALPRAR